MASVCALQKAGQRSIYFSFCWSVGRRAGRVVVLANHFCHRSCLIRLRRQPHRMGLFDMLVDAGARCYLEGAVWLEPDDYGHGACFSAAVGRSEKDESRSRAWRSVTSSSLSGGGDALLAAANRRHEQPQRATFASELDRLTPRTEMRVVHAQEVSERRADGINARGLFFAATRWQELPHGPPCHRPA